MYARFAYITYCFKVTTPIRSHKMRLCDYQHQLKPTYIFLRTEESNFVR